LTVIADGASNELRAFDGAGQLMWTRGRAGSGPQEFQGMLGLWLVAPDTVVTYDVPTQRLSYWSERGDFLGAVQLRLDFIPRLVGRMADGSFIGLRPNRPTILAPGTTRLDSVSAYRISSTGNSAHYLGRFPSSTSIAIAVPALGGRTLQTGAPVSPTEIAAVGPDYVWVGHGSDWTLRKYRFDGSIVDSLTVPGHRQPFTAGHRQAWLAEAVRRSRPEQRADLQRHFERFPMPELLPTYDALEIGPGESVWARRGVGPGVDSATWDIYGVDGCWLGGLAVPARTRPTQLADGIIVATFLGSDDIEQVGVFSLPHAFGRL
jgi:hypothetical protein